MDLIYQSENVVRRSKIFFSSNESLGVQRDILYPRQFPRVGTSRKTWDYPLGKLSLVLQDDKNTGFILVGKARGHHVNLLMREWWKVVQGRKADA
jgi:hypothetical protein